MKITYDNPDNLQEDNTPIPEIAKKGLLIPVHVDVGLQQSIPVSMSTTQVPVEPSGN
jgi:hypothetical protein